MLVLTERRAYQKGGGWPENGAELAMKLNFSRRSQYCCRRVRREASGTVGKCRHLGPYRSSFCGFIVQDAHPVFVRFAWFAIERRSRKDVRSVYSLLKKGSIAGQIDMGVDIDEQTTGHGGDQGDQEAAR